MKNSNHQKAGTIHPGDVEEMNYQCPKIDQVMVYVSKNQKSSASSTPRLIPSPPPKERKQEKKLTHDSITSNPTE